MFFEHMRLIATTFCQCRTNFFFQRTSARIIYIMLRCSLVRRFQRTIQPRKVRSSCFEITANVRNKRVQNQKITVVEVIGMCINPCDMHMFNRAAIHNLSKSLTLGSGCSIGRPVVPPILAAATIAVCSQFAVPRIAGKKNRVGAALNAHFCDLGINQFNPHIAVRDPNRDPAPDLI